MPVQRKLKKIGKLKNKLKNKNGFVQSTDFVIIFATTIILGNKIVDGSLEIELETTMANTDYIPEMTTTLRSGLYPKYAINLGDEFKVHMKGDIVLFHVAGKPVTTKLSSTASGVGEVYFKYNPTK